MHSVPHSWSATSLRTRSDLVHRGYFRRPLVCRMRRKRLFSAASIERPAKSQPPPVIRLEDAVSWNTVLEFSVVLKYAKNSTCWRVWTKYGNNMLPRTELGREKEFRNIWYDEDMFNDLEMVLSTANAKTGRGGAVRRRFTVERYCARKRYILGEASQRDINDEPSGGGRWYCPRARPLL